MTAHPEPTQVNAIANTVLEGDRVVVDQTRQVDRVKVLVALHPEGGWPPVDGENLWAVPIGGGLYRLDNVPFFAHGLAVDDIVRAAADTQGELLVTETVEASGNCTIRVLPLENSDRQVGRGEVLAIFERLGVTGEGIEAFNLVALNIPGTAELRPVRELLADGEANGWWEYQEGCVTDRWEQAQ